jgi:carbon monoxide dehydrogenase subunit G
VATRVERSIEVEVPVRTAYDQWTQFEDFPRFMSGVKQVRQIGDAMTHWVAEIAGVRREWDAAILEQVPDTKVAWAATTGATNAGAVYFEAIGAERTRVRLALDYEPEGVVERIGEFLKVVERTTVADLDRFKQFIESRGSATGDWRGTVRGGDVEEHGDVGDPVARQSGDAVSSAGSTAELDRDLGTGDDDPAGSVVADYPGDRTSHTETGAQGTDDEAAGFLTGYPDDRTPGQTGTVDDDADDPASTVVAGYPGDRTSHTETGAQSGGDEAAGFVTGYPGERTPSHTDADAEDAGPTDLDTPDRKGETSS